MLFRSCGVVRFVPNGATKYHVYYLSYHQSNGGAGLRFSWHNCSSQQDRRCAMAAGAPRHASHLISPTFCKEDGRTGARKEQAQVSVVAIEGRQVSPSSGRPDFHALTSMELVASPEERAALLASHPAGSSTAARIFLEPRTNTVRMDDQLPALWARGGERVSIELNASVGEYLTFQVGVYAVRNLSEFKLVFGSLTHKSKERGGSGGELADLPSTAFTCFNLGGNDYHGQPFDRTAAFSVAAGAVGSLWVGVDLPANGSAGTFRQALSLSARESSTGAAFVVALSLSLNVHPTSTGAPIADRGDGDIYSMSRLRWLDSRVGIDDEVPSPFVPPKVRARGGGASSGFEVRLLNKVVTVGESGFYSQIAVDDTHAPDDSNATQFLLLSRPMNVIISRAATNEVLPLGVLKPVKIVGQNNTGIYWEATLGAVGVLNVKV